MKKRIMLIRGGIFSIIIAMLLFNVYIFYIYNVDLITYIKKSQDISAEEHRWLNNHGKIIYASDQNAPPLAFKSYNGQYKGILVDFMNALSIEIGQEVDFRIDDRWKKSLDNILTKQIDCYGIIPSDDRSDYFLFSDPIYIIKGNIVKPKKYTNIKNYKNLKPYKIAVPKGDYSLEFLKENLQDGKFILTEDVSEALDLVQEGKADVAIGDEPVIKYYMESKGLNRNYETLEESVYEKPIVIAVPRGEKKLINILNKGIFSLRKKETFSSIKEKWYKDDLRLIGESKNSRLTGIILVAIFILLILTYIIYIWTNLLKEKVKSSTKELMESKNTLNNTLDSITDMVIVVTKDYSITHANNAFYEFLKKDGYFRRFKVSIFSEIIEETFSENFELRKEYIINERTLRVNTFPFKDNSEILQKIVIVIKDITKEKIIEKDMIQTNKMAAIGELAAGIAHEIRNPLGIIRNYCYLLKDRTNTYNENKEYVLSIENNIGRATKIIGNLLNFARISNEELKMTNVKEFIDNILLLENKSLEKEEIEVIVECDENLSFKLYKESLNHIFLNLISNSIDAIRSVERKGKIIITAMVKNNILYFKIYDNGCGIKEDKLTKIFNPFYTSKPIGKGTGLGLYITYNEVEKCGGNIRVESIFGKETSFYLNFSLLEEWENEL
ncbi:transporter substrate-binding domain-containing protein [Clostridium senegalense]|uniref:transporter substrate-binding domain-containing protein n=1 Tax=Clostridium senegalense TaxID=1465809 RepID=UPI000287FD57|nr:transporter substrate-binding domain-containing protein [Clostridium senegalense]